MRGMQATVVGGIAAGSGEGIRCLPYGVTTQEEGCTNHTFIFGGGIVTRRHVRSQQEWYCLPRWEPTVKDRC
jgi:hypothetical protein